MLIEKNLGIDEITGLNKKKVLNRVIFDKNLIILFEYEIILCDPIGDGYRVIDSDRQIIEMDKVIYKSIIETAQSYLEK